MSFCSQVWAIVAKDVRSELRTKEIVTSVLVFALLVMVIFNFAFEPGAETTGLIAPGVLWVSFTFAGVLGLNRSFILEKERGCLDGLLLCPVDRSAIYLGKMLASTTFMLAVEAVALPMFAVLFNLSILVPQLLLITLLGTLGFAGVGTLFAAMAVNTRAREIMLPVLLLPVAVPVLIAAVKASGVALGSTVGGSLWSWLQLITVFDAIFLTVSTLVFEYVVEQ